MSRCETVDDFVGVFRRFSDGESIFIVTKDPKPLGTIQPVAITLKGGRAVLSGTGEVVEVHSSASGVAGRPGMRIKFTSLDDEGRAVLKRMGEPEERAALPSPRRTSLGVGVTPPSAATSGPLPGMPNVGKPPDPDDETTSVSGESAMMHRATGSSVIIPANPFSELPDESLMGFIECTLYEDSGLIRVPDDNPHASGSDRFESVESQPSGLPAWWPKDDQGRVTPPPVREPSADGTPPQTIAPPRAASPAVAPEPAAGFASETTPAPSYAAPQVTAESALLQPQFGAYETGMVARSPRWKTPVVAAVGAALGALLMGYFIWGGDKGGDDRGSSASEASASGATRSARAQAAEPEAAEPEAAEPEAAEPEAAEPEAAEPEAAEPEAAEPEAAEPEAAEPAVAAAAADPAGSGCTLKVVTSSDGATVSVAGKSLGTTPLEREVGCGTVAVTLEHPRYATVTESVTLVAGESTPLEVRLQRPTHKLTITSNPSGASVTLAGRNVGKTPVTVAVPGYEKARLKITRDGYQPWSEEVYARRPKQTVSAKLKSLVKRVPAKRDGKKRK